jgi:hypothetical protein
MMSCLESIAEAQHMDGIVQVCSQSRVVRFAVLDLVLGIGADEVAERHDDENEERQLRRLLTNFRSTGKDTLEKLNGQEKESIGVLMGLPAFHKKFKESMPSTVLSSEESTPEREGQQPGPQA